MIRHEEQSDIDDMICPNCRYRGDIFCIETVSHNYWQLGFMWRRIVRKIKIEIRRALQ